MLCALCAAAMLLIMLTLILHSQVLAAAVRAYEYLNHGSFSDFRLFLFCHVLCFVLCRCWRLQCVRMGSSWRGVRRHSLLFCQLTPCLTSSHWQSSRPRHRWHNVGTVAQCVGLRAVCIGMCLLYHSVTCVQLCMCERWARGGSMLRQTRHQCSTI